MNDLVIMSRQELMILINTLKSIDVNGFDSMDKLVGAVTFLTEVMARKEDSTE